MPFFWLVVSLLMCFIAQCYWRSRFRLDGGWRNAFVNSHWKIAEWGVPQILCSALVVTLPILIASWYDIMTVAVAYMGILFFYMAGMVMTYDTFLKEFYARHPME
jgi:hypothetical protein